MFLILTLLSSISFLHAGPPVLTPLNGSFTRVESSEEDTLVISPTSNKTLQYVALSSLKNITAFLKRKGIDISSGAQVAVILYATETGSHPTINIEELVRTIPQDWELISIETSSSDETPQSPILKLQKKCSLKS
jgi:hypothetical protein